MAVVSTGKLFLKSDSALSNKENLIAELSKFTDLYVSHIRAINEVLLVDQKNDDFSIILLDYSINSEDFMLINEIVNQDGYIKTPFIILLPLDLMPVVKHFFKFDDPFVIYIPNRFKIILEAIKHRSLELNPIPYLLDVQEICSPGIVVSGKAEFSYNGATLSISPSIAPVMNNIEEVYESARFPFRNILRGVFERNRNSEQITLLNNSFVKSEIEVDQTNKKVVINLKSAA